MFYGIPLRKWLRLAVCPSATEVFRQRVELLAVAHITRKQNRTKNKSRPDGHATSTCCFPNSKSGICLGSKKVIRAYLSVSWQHADIRALHPRDKVHMPYAPWCRRRRSVFRNPLLLYYCTTLYVLFPLHTVVCLSVYCTCSLYLVNRQFSNEV